jgi:dsRNA-specific ribonuclease
MKRTAFLRSVQLGHHLTISNELFVNTFSRDRTHAEFIGKRLYDFLVSDFVVYSYPKLTKDQLSSVLFTYQSKNYLLNVANGLKFQSLIKHVQKNYEEREKQNTYIIGSIYRMIGSYYLTSDLERTRAFLSEFIISKEVDLEDILESFHPIQDIEVLYSGSNIEYFLIHDKEKYFCTLKINGEKHADSIALSESIAKKRAAQKALFAHYTSQ